MFKFKTLGNLKDINQWKRNGLRKSKMNQWVNAHAAKFGNQSSIN